MLRIFLIALVFYLAQVIRPTAAKECLNIPNTTFEFDEAEDSFTNSVSSIDGCLDACLNRANCQAFTWDESSPLRCLLFMQIRGTLSCGRCQSGIIPTQVMPERSGCVTSLDDVLDETETDSAIACLEQCDGLEGCQYVTWYNSTSLFPNFCF